MTRLENEIEIEAPKSRVWQALREVDRLENYDPGVLRSEALTAARSGVGAERRCDLGPGGWFKERITEQSEDSLTFELYDCTLPVRRLKHQYQVKDLGGRVRVSQVMTYELKYGVLGRLLDTLFVRKKWDAGIKGFLVGLKNYLEKA